MAVGFSYLQDESSHEACWATVYKTGEPPFKHPVTSTASDQQLDACCSGVLAHNSRHHSNCCWLPADRQQTLPCFLDGCHC